MYILVWNSLGGRSVLRRTAHLSHGTAIIVVRAGHFSVITAVTVVPWFVVVVEKPRAASATHAWNKRSAARSPWPSSKNKECYNQKSLVSVSGNMHVYPRTNEVA